MTRLGLRRLCARAIIETVKGGADAALMRELRSVADRKHSRADQLLCFGVLASSTKDEGTLRLRSKRRSADWTCLRTAVWFGPPTAFYGAAGIVGVSRRPLGARGGGASI